MKEYIKREDAIQSAKHAWAKGLEPSQYIECLPTADVAEVRHGAWVGLEYDGYADGNPVYDLWECSECGEEVRGEDVPSTHPWCHSCGARMDKE